MEKGHFGGEKTVHGKKISYTSLILRLNCVRVQLPRADLLSELHNRHSVFYCSVRAEVIWNTSNWIDGQGCLPLLLL